MRADEDHHDGNEHDDPVDDHDRDGDDHDGDDRDGDDDKNHDLILPRLLSPEVERMRMRHKSTSGAL